MQTRRLRFAGFTLMEILIVISIIMLLLMLVLINMRSQIDKANDAKRKTDLSKIQKAFEENFNDAQCYPVETILSKCNGGELDPYLKKIPCDPTTKEPYLYVPGAPSLCAGYRVCAKLKLTSDPDIERIGCSPSDGCGWAPGYNYCLSAGFDAAKTLQNSGTAGPISGPTPIPTATPTPFFGGVNACTRGMGTGVCNNVGNPQALGCPSAFSSANCDDKCGDPWYWCP